MAEEEPTGAPAPSPLPSRPEWFGATPGLPIDCVFRIHGAPPAPGVPNDIVIPSRTSVALLRPGAAQPRPEDRFEASFVYGPGQTNRDVHASCIAPIVRKVVEGYNACVILFGATGA
jgi:hypothetical protein